MTKSPKHRLGVLYVDDEKKSCKYFTKRFKTEFPTFTAHNVAEGKQTMDDNEGSIALIIADVRMPGESGVELLTYAHQHYPNISRWLVTAYSDHDATVQAINEGAVQRHISKPWNLNLLASEIEEELQMNWRSVNNKKRLQRALNELQSSLNLPPAQTKASTNTPSSSSGLPIDLESVVQNHERALIVQALNGTQGNVNAAAKLLKTTPRKLHYRIDKLEIETFID